MEQAPVTSPGAGSAGGRKPDTSEKQTARDRIFAVAKDLFYRRGIRAVGVETIVAEAGATKMSLYRTFPSKDDLVAAYLKERDDLYWQWWDAALQPHRSAARKIRALFDAVAAKTKRPGYRGCPFTNAIVEFPDAGHPGRAIAAANKQEQRRRLRELATEAGAENADELGDQLFLLMEGAYVSDQLTGPTRPAEGLVSAAEMLLAMHVIGRE